MVYTEKPGTEPKGNSMRNTSSSQQQSATGPNSHSRPSLFATFSERQLSRIVLEALRCARQDAEPGEDAHSTLCRAANMAFEELDSRQMRQEDRVWRTLMRD